MDHSDLVDERHEWLLGQLFEHRRVMTVTAADQLDVSVDTIRRDLRALHDRGLLRRVHGGAVPLSMLPDSFVERTATTSTRLAAAVVNRFRAGQVIGLDAGSTCVEIANLIPPTLDVTIITNNPAAAVALANHRAAHAVLLGGTLDLTWMASVGSETVDAWRGYRLDVAVLGVCGFDPTDAITTNSQAEVATKRALLTAAAEVVVPVQGDKFGAQGSFVIADSTVVNTVVLDPNTNDELVQLCRSANLDAVVAS